MKKVKFLCEQDYLDYKRNSNLTGGFCCSGFYHKPLRYPCILVWDHHDNQEEEWNVGEYIYIEDLL